MSTVDASPADTPWIDAALARGERTVPQVDVRRLLAAVLLAVPLLLGWMVGRVVVGASYAWAAAVEGYTRGRQPRTASRVAAL